VHGKGKQVGVGDLTVMEEELRLQHRVSSPRKEVKQHHRGRSTGAVGVARVAEDAQARGTHAGDQAGRWAPPSALLIAQLIHQIEINNAT
jgi:hypothetical protein